MDNNNQKIATLTTHYDNVIIAHNDMTFKGVQYALADNIDPTLFISQDYRDKVYHCPSIPLYDGRFIKISPDGDGNWNDLTQLKLTSVKESVKTIGDGFLMECTHLKSVDLSGFKNISNVGSHFMYNCSSLESLLVPDKPATKWSVSLADFMEFIPKTAKIDCLNHLYSYENCMPWKYVKNQLVGGYNYEVDSHEFWSSINYNVKVGELTYGTLQLLNDKQLLPDGASFEIRSASECLNASIGTVVDLDTCKYYLALCPTEEAIDKPCLVVLNAYYNGEYVCGLSINFSDINY